jgi:hypothetical protein
VGILRPLFDVIPDARVVVLLRDPRQSVASTCSMYTVIGQASFERDRTGRFGRRLAESLAGALTRGMQVAAEEPDRVRVVRYEDLVADPIGTLEGIHAAFGLPVSATFERAARAWLAANPQGRHGVHTYDLATYGLDEETVLRLFGDAELAMSRIGLSSRK